MKNITVIKIGGSTFGSGDTTIDDIVALQKKGHALVVIHGGGNAVTDWLKRQGAATRFVRGEGVPGYGSSRPGGRRRENLTREEEAAFLAPFLEKAQVGGILIVGEIKQALDARLGRKVALSSAYNLLHRHGWRKLAPDKRHPQADIAAQEFFQERGANVLPINSYSFTAERGFSARVVDGAITRTVLVGPVEAITRVTTPFCQSIAAATQVNPEAFVVAIDGIAYAAFTLSSELV